MVCGHIYQLHQSNTNIPLFLAVIDPVQIQIHNTQNVEKSLHLNTNTNTYITNLLMTWCDFVASILPRNFCLYPLTLLAELHGRLEKNEHRYLQNTYV